MTLTISKTCFIAAPAGANLGVLSKSLKERGIRVLVPNDLNVGVDWASEIQKQIAQADFVVGIITADQSSSWVLFELGQASALGRRIILIVSPKALPIPFTMHQFVVLKTEIDNADAIGFALDQVISAPVNSIRERSSLSTLLIPLGKKTDEFIKRLDREVIGKEWNFKELVVDAIRESGADVVSVSPSEAVGADIAVWSDVLEPFVGNPLLVGVKSEVKEEQDVAWAAWQLAQQVATSGSMWGVLLYSVGPEFDGELFAESSPNIFILSIRSLLERLRIQAFPELIRDLRNLRVHGMR
jgi:hypothetical protein